ncbi:hypothetical protein GEMRC1_001900 [Eukaryota sp. GEM-RC1]
MSSLHDLLSICLDLDESTLLNINQQDSFNLSSIDSAGNSLLHYLSLEGSTEALELLFRHVNDLSSITSMTNSLGQSPLHLASASGSLCCVTLLLSHNVPIDLSDSKGFLPITYALLANHFDIARLLFNHLPTILYKPFPLLHHVIELGLISSLEFLLSLPGVNINCLNDLSQTPLHAAVISNQSEMIDILLQRKCVCESFDQLGIFPLFSAISFGYLDTALKLLLKCQQSLFLVTNSGYSVLHAISFLDYETLNSDTFFKIAALLPLIIQNYFDAQNDSCGISSFINAVDLENQMSPLLFSIFCANYTVSCLLLDLFGDLFILDTVCKGNRNIFHLLTDSDHDLKLSLRLLNILSQKSSDFIFKIFSLHDSLDRTPLMTYFLCGYSDILSLILDFLKNTIESENVEVLLETLKLEHV